MDKAPRRNLPQRTTFTGNPNPLEEEPDVPESDPMKEPEARESSPDKEPDVPESDPTKEPDARESSPDKESDALDSNKESLQGNSSADLFGTDEEDDTDSRKIPCSSDSSNKESSDNQNSKGKESEKPSLNSVGSFETDPSESELSPQTSNSGESSDKGKENQSSNDSDLGSLQTQDPSQSSKSRSDNTPSNTESGRGSFQTSKSSQRAEGNRTGSSMESVMVQAPGSLQTDSSQDDPPVEAGEDIQPGEELEMNVIDVNIAPPVMNNPCPSLPQQDEVIRVPEPSARQNAAALRRSNRLNIFFWSILVASVMMGFIIILVVIYILIRLGVIPSNFLLESKPWRGHPTSYFRK